MADTPKPAAKKAATIWPLRCLNDGCRALLAYEVQAGNVLYVDLARTARQEGSMRYFPCPSCHGKNIVEPGTNEKGQPTHRVARWEQ